MVSWVGASERAHRNARYAGGAYLGGISVGWLTTDQAASGHERTPSVPPTGLADGFGREDWPYHRHACGFTPVGHGSPARIRLGGSVPVSPIDGDRRPVLVGRTDPTGRRW